MNNDIAAVVVVYRSGPVKPLVEQLAIQGITSVVVVDNGSPHAYRHEWTTGPCRVRELAFGTNLGYGAAINRALPELEERMVLVSNPDVMPHAGAVRALAYIMMTSDRVGAVGPKVLDVAGERYPSFRRFPSLWESMWHGAIGWIAPASFATRSYRMSDIDPESAVVVPWISGSCLLCSREALRAVGGFDTKYQLYMEDVDLCRRLWIKGYQIVYQPEAVVTHVGGVSSSQRRLRAVLAHHRSMATYAAAEQSSSLILILVELGIALRCGLSLVRTILSGVIRN
ncbi:MAG: glycosyltransferase family 2 protein [Ferrimicrobium sp.]